MNLVTPEEARRLDQFAWSRWHMPGLLLMENAARMVALKALDMMREQRGVVLVLAGPGNNGGDALAAARHLLNMGQSVRVIAAASADGYKGDAATNADILQKMGVFLYPLDYLVAEGTLEATFTGVSLIIDGLYGTGLSRDIAGNIHLLISRVNAGHDLVLSIDLPSGVHGFSGQLLGISVIADVTVTLGLPKPGLYQYPGAAHAGEVTVADLGIPISMALPAPTVTLLDKPLISSLLPKRAPDLHKGSAGRILMLAGSERMCGAAVLCAAAAYRSGAGIVHLVVPRSIATAVTIQLPEAVLSMREDTWSADAAASMLDMAEQAACVAIGPGMGMDGAAADWLRAFLKSNKKPLVCDADALRLLAASKELLDLLPPQTIITPHPAEMAALCGMKTADIQKDRLSAAKEFAVLHQLVVVLKGAGTVIAAPDGQLFINPTGNSGMATAGSGDVLTGMIAAYLASGKDPLAAALCGCYLHGIAGDLAAQEGTAGLMASDLVNSIRSARLQVENGG